MPKIIISHIPVQSQYLFIYFIYYLQSTRSKQYSMSNMNIAI